MESHAAPRAALFDLDGTLLDTLEDIAFSANRVLESRGFPAHPVDAYRFFIGHGSRTLMERALPADRRARGMVDECTEEFLRTYGANWHRETRPFEGIHDLLGFLSEEGVRLAVFSNKAHSFTVKCVDYFFHGYHFDVVMGQQEGFAMKPDPAGALKIADQMKLLAGDFLYAGDSATDMKTARAAGMLAVGVLWGLRDEAELKTAGAEILVSHPHEIKDLFSCRLR